MPSIKKLVYLLCITIGLVSSAAAQQPNPEKVMQEWVELNKPGEAHSKLDVFVGKWKTTTKIWMKGPSGEPNVSEGLADVNWILGGRYLQDTTRAMLVIPAGDGSTRSIPYHGLGLLGHDNVRKQYVRLWIENQSTHFPVSRGNFDSEGKVLTMYGTMDEPALGVYNRMVRYQVVIESPEKHVFSMYDLHAGEDFKVLEVVYEKRP